MAVFITLGLLYNSFFNLRASSNNVHFEKLLRLSHLIHENVMALQYIQILNYVSNSIKNVMMFGHVKIEMSVPETV